MGSVYAARTEDQEDMLEVAHAWLLASEGDLMGACSKSHGDQFVASVISDRQGWPLQPVKDSFNS